MIDQQKLAKTVLFRWTSFVLLMQSAFLEQQRSFVMELKLEFVQQSESGPVSQVTELKVV